MNEMLDPRALAPDVLRAQNGDPNAMSRILAAVQDMVYYSCLRMLRNETEAQDASQDVLITIYQKIDSLSDPLSFLGWVKRIAANCCKDRLSKTNREFLLNDTEEGQDAFSFYEDLDEQRVPDKALDNAETRRMINELIDRLPDEQRVCVILYYFNEMKTREIAESLGVSEGTVKSRLNYARKSIKEGVGAYEKQGIKLYGLSPLLFLGYFLRAAGSAVHAPFSVSIPGAAAADAASSASAAGRTASAAGRTVSANNAARTASAAGRTAAHTASAAGKAAGAAAAGTAAKAAASAGFGAFLATTAGKIVAAVAITAVLGGAVTGTVFAVKAASEKADRTAAASVQASSDPGVEENPFEEEWNPDDEDWNPDDEDWYGDDEGWYEENDWQPSAEDLIPDSERPEVLISAREVSSPIVSVVCGSSHSVALCEDGTVTACGSGKFGQCDVFDWTDIVAIAAGDDHTIGVKKDGTAVACGKNRYGQCRVSDWTDIVAADGGNDHTVGLRSDGTVVACGSDSFGACDVNEWTDIVAISAGTFHTVGLKSDGTVVACGNNKDGECLVSGWTDIVAIAAGGYHTVGLKSDGTVVACGQNDHDQLNVSDWTDITAITAGSWRTVGIKKDGSVIGVGDWDDDRQIAEWSDVVAIEMGNLHLLGRKADGTILANGNDLHGKCDIDPWNAHVAPAPQPEPTAQASTAAKLIKSYESGQDGSSFEASYSDTMFTCDLDGDGAEEEISYHSEAYDRVTVTVGDATIALKDNAGCGIRDAFVVDLDPESPLLHLAVNIFSEYYGDTCYLLHIENGKFKTDLKADGSLYFDEEHLFFAPEATEVLGTRGPGCRALCGDSLTPDSEWYECRPNAGMGRCYYNADPLRLKRDLPCTIDGVETVIPKGSDVYYYGVLASEEACKVKTADGRIAIVKLEKTGSWPKFNIDGIPQDDYFTELLYLG